LELQVSHGRKSRNQAGFADPRKICHKRVKAISNADELFAKSRQFLYTELKKFTHYSSKEIREQYILHQVKAGKTIYELGSVYWV
jgi:hypothetical protein